MSAGVWQSYSDFYKNSAYARFPQEHRCSGGVDRFQMIQVDQQPHSFSDPAVNETVIAISLDSDREYEWRWKIGGHSYGHQAYRDEVIIVPSQMASEWEVDASRRLLILTVPDSILQNLLKTGSQSRIRSAFRPFSGRVMMDQFIQASMLRLWQTLGSNSKMERKLGDGLLTALLAHFLAQAGDISEQAEQIVLPSWRLRNVKNYVDAHLDEKISMQELADAGGLSLRHFARSFRCELGKTPHKWLMEQRLDRARTLLVETDEPLCQTPLRIRLERNN